MIPTPEAAKALELVTVPFQPRPNTPFRNAILRVDMQPHHGKLPLTMLTSKDRVTTFDVPVGIISVACSIAMEVMFYTTTDIVKLSLDNLYNQLATFEEKALLLAQTDWKLIPGYSRPLKGELHSPVHGTQFPTLARIELSEPSHYLGGWHEGPQHYNDASFPGLLAQLAMPGTGATIRVYQDKADLLKSLVEMLGYMIHYKDVQPDTLYLNPKDALDLQYTVEKLTEHEPYWKREALFHGNRAGMDQRIYTLAWVELAARLGAQQQDWSWLKAPELRVVVDPELPEGNHLILSTKLPDWLPPTEAIPAPMSMAVALPTSLHMSTYSGTTTHYEYMTAGIFRCHTPGLMGWLRRKV